jgi:hypothetical protein
VPQTSRDLDRYVYPLAKPIASPKITIDVSDAPASKKWAEVAANLAESWYPEICRLLSTQDFKPPREIKLIFRAKQDEPAYATGDQISVNAKWITDHPDDLGMIVHELTHLIQNYPRNKADVGWLVEGIADYIRWWRYEPEMKRSKIDPIKATYHDSYRTTAFWLAWVSKTYDRRLVPTLDLALRKGDDPMPIFKSLTRKDADRLWTEFIEAYQKL